MKKALLPAGFLLTVALPTFHIMQTFGQTPVPAAAHSAQPLFKSAAYTLYPDRVVQGTFEAKALSRTELTSNYKSPANLYQSPQIAFKFSINGPDNEAVPGQDHIVVAVPKTPGSVVEPPVIIFGKRYVDKAPIPVNTFMAPNTRLKLRLDMRPVLAQIKEKGFFTTLKGEKIYAENFKRVMVAGGTAPMSWDFDNLAGRSEMELKDPDGNGIYEITLNLNAPEQAKTTAGRWKQTLNTDDFPQLQSPYPIVDALYNQALEEARRAVEADSTFRTGKEWAGVWTRDISYSIILAQALLQPRVGMNSLMRKVTTDGRIIQDTGTGGAWPCSTDRMIWAVAAYEIYLVTGDEAWLHKVLPIIRKSVEDDLAVAYDAETGLVRGESSFLDWREQTYPRWMEPADIYQSETLGTNAVHCQANRVLAQMARRVGENALAQKHEQLAETIKKGMNQHLWQEKKGYYGQYLYGRTHLTLSPKAEALGEALTVLFGIAEGAQASRVVASTPTVPFGVPCIYPQIPVIPSYHNNAVWPFVQSYFGLAAKKAGNAESFLESFAAVARPAALFVTNKENFVAENGDYAGTVINSSVMLWSLSGYLSLVYKGLFGLEFKEDGLHVAPFVPKEMQGNWKLSNFKYRNALIDFEMTGWGNQMASISIDGAALVGNRIPTDLTGRHTLKITLTGQMPAPAGVNRVKNAVSPDVPEISDVAYGSSVSGGKGFSATWKPVPGAVSYRIVSEGKTVITTPKTEFKDAERVYKAFRS